MSENDAQTELKKRARRRLVGAVALALLAAIVLPMVMDQEPGPTAPDIQILIPSQDDGSFTARAMPARPDAKPATQTPVVVSPEATNAEPAAAESKPDGVASEGKSAPVTFTEAKPAPVGSEQWIVQLGAYRDLANVRNLQTKLKAQGYSIYTEVLSSPDGSKKTRVRAGPFPSKEAAEKARERIKRIGVNGVVAQKQ
jgi:DedD protein